MSTETLSRPSTPETDQKDPNTPEHSTDGAFIPDSLDTAAMTAFKPENDPLDTTEATPEALRTSPLAALIDRGVNRISQISESVEASSRIRTADSESDPRADHLERIGRAKEFITRIGKSAYERAIVPVSKNIYEKGQNALITATGTTILVTEKLTTKSAEVLVKAGKAASERVEKRALKREQDSTFTDAENGYDQNIIFTQETERATAKEEKLAQRREEALARRADALERKSVRRELRAERNQARIERFSRTRAGRIGKKTLNFLKRSRNGAKAAYNAFKAPIDQ